MKVLAVSGSPREGNTDAMLKRVLDGAKEAGAGIELVRLRDRKIEFCDGCDRCYEKGKSCHVMDDMQPLYGKLIEADAIVLGSPNYFRNVTAIMKNFIDRCNPLCDPRRLAGKKAAVVMPGGQPLENLKDAAKALEFFAEDMKMELLGEILATADAPKKVLEDGKTMQQCFELGKKLAVK